VAEAPSNPSFSGLDMPEDQSVKKTRRSSTESTAGVSYHEVLDRFDTLSRVATRLTRSRGLTLIYLLLALTLPYSAPIDLSAGCIGRVSDIPDANAQM